MWVHNLNPSLFQWGIVDIRYYSLAYILGGVFSYFLFYYLMKKKKIDWLKSTDQLDTLVIYLMLGVVVGGRVGYFLFYRPLDLFSVPWEIIYVWQGGMSFHGGMIGVGLAAWLFARKFSVYFFKIADIGAVIAFFCLFFGRLTNFINGELVGTVTDVPWCVVFPQIDEFCRHPSQLYEAAKNVIMFFVTLYLLFRTLAGKLPWGVTSAAFLIGYGTLRFIITFWREDPSLFWTISWGQVMSFLMIPVGLILLWKVLKK